MAQISQAPRSWCDERAVGAKRVAEYLIDMTDDTNKSPLLESPEAPEALKWVLTVWHHVRANWGDLMRPAVVAAVAGSFLLGFYLDSIYYDKILRIRDERIEQLKDSNRLGDTPAKGKQDLLAIIAGKTLLYPERDPKQLWFRVELVNNSGKQAVCKLLMKSLYDETRRRFIMEPGGVDTTLQLSDSGASMKEVAVNGNPVDFDLAFINDKDIITPGAGEHWQTNLHPDPLGPGSYTFTLRSDGENCTSDPTIFRIDFRGGFDAEIRTLRN